MDDELRCAIRADDLPTVKLLVEGGASIAALNNGFYSTLGYAAVLQKASIVQWLVKEGGAPVSEADRYGFTALLRAAQEYGEHKFEIVQWLLEYGGANIAETNPEGETVWDFLRVNFLHQDPAAVTGLLRVMVLQGSPPAALTARLLPEHRTVVQEGARLRARLPAYLARRRALLDANCPLIGPLQALVIGYEEPTTTEELWATGLGAE
jgi:hypothetical protein